MTTSDARGSIVSIDEENSPLCFSEWLKRRRQELNLTQEQLARRVNYSVFAIRKIEMGERRPSKQLAGLLAQSLEISCENQAIFIQVARGERSVEYLLSVLPGRAILPAGEPGQTSGNMLRVNLPRPLTPFIGREPELVTLGQLLCDPQCALLTIVGPGGIGKTRLAIEAASQSQHRFPDGVWFVSLAGVNSSMHIVPAIADTIQFMFQDPTDPQTQLLRYLYNKKALLILDNAEHLLDGAGLFSDILNACSQVKLLVTSRERINLLSEWVIEVQGLPVPASDQVEQFESYSSVALFLQSARRVQVGFELKQENRRCVLRICRMMEGMPLGIELAAAWVGLLPCAEIAKEIERNINFLTVSMRDLPERQRSLRATLDYSWNLLHAEEKLILSRLSVFKGSFRLEAAIEICGASLSILSSFRNKMLLYRTEEDFYMLHELIRQYAELKLREDPAEDERVKESHSAYYVRCLAEWEKALKSSQQVDTFNEMARVIDNLSRGWQRMVTRFNPETLKNGQFRPDLFHLSLFSLSLFYEMRNRSLEAILLFKESVTSLKRVQDAFEKMEESTVFYAILGHLTAYLGLHHNYIPVYDKGRAYLEEAIQLLDKGQSRLLRAQAQVMLAYTYSQQGEYQKCADLIEESREVFREEGDRWWYLLSNINLTPSYISLGKLEESELLLQEGLGLLEQGDLRLGLPFRERFAHVLFLKKNFSRAEQLLQESLQLSYQLENLDFTTDVWFDLGRLALDAQKIKLAEEYFQKSINLLKESGLEYDLSIFYLYLGKCFAAGQDLPAARDQFQQVIKLGQELDKPHMIYWGLVNIGRIYLEEGQPEKALEITLALRHFPIQHTTIKGEWDGLLEDLQTKLPQGQVDAIMKQVDSQVSQDTAGVNALAYAMQLVME